MKRIVAQEQLPLIPEQEIKTLQTLGQILQTFPTEWENWGDQDYITYGGRQIKYSPEYQEFEIEELITPDWGIEGFLLEGTSVWLNDIFQNADSDIVVTKLIPTKEALNVARSGGIEEFKPENVEGFIASVVYGWTSYYGAENIASWSREEFESEEAMERDVTEYLETDRHLDI